MSFNLRYFRVNKRVHPDEAIDAASAVRCLYPVHDGLGVGFHKCWRRANECVGGFRFCKQHAKMVKAQERKP